jgi:hypothetical protein
MSSPFRNLFTAFAVAGLFLVTPAPAAESAGLSAKELAAKLTAVGEGSALIRLRLETKQPAETLQLQVKERRTRSSTEAVYQVLWPKERKGEALILRSGGRGSGGYVVVPGEKPKPLSAGQMSQPAFGSDLSYQDLVENFFAWDQQAIVGQEDVGRVNCVVLESKPGKGASGPYASVKSWIDPRRLVPLRVEKYGSAGKLIRRIDTTRVANDDRGHSIPANLEVKGGRGGGTEVDGSRIKHDVEFQDRDFTPEGVTAASDR